MRFLVPQAWPMMACPSWILTTRLVLFDTLVARSATVLAQAAPRCSPSAG